MAGTNVGAWLVVIVAPLLFAGSGVLLRWGLRRPRDKRRLRCPSCSYDMRGHVPGQSGAEPGGNAGGGGDGLAAPVFVCPECGHDAKTLDNLLSEDRRRRWATVAAMAIGVVGLCLTGPCVFSAIGWVLEQPTIHAIRKDGGSVEFQPVPLFVFDGRDGEPPLLPTCVRAIEVSFGAKSSTSSASARGLARLRHLRYLSVRGPAVTDAHIASLAGLTELKSLGLSGPQITDAGLVHLKGLSQLRVLGLHNTQVTGAGLAELKGLRQLQMLAITDGPLTDAGMVHLKGLSQLRYLDLRNTQVTDAGLVSLKGLSQLVVLNLSGAPVTDAGLAHLKALPNLSHVGLSGTQVTDAGLAHLAELPQLAAENPPPVARFYWMAPSPPHRQPALAGGVPMPDRSLLLDGTLVTDRGLAHVKKMWRLESLNLSNTQVTDAGVAKLKEALQYLDIKRQPRQQTGGPVPSR